MGEMCCSVETRPMRLGLLGFGRWGKTYYKTLMQMPAVDLIAIAGRPHQLGDMDPHSRVTVREDWRAVCEDPSIDGIIVATPPETHYEIVKFCLERNLPALVEKPFTLCSALTEELRKLSRHRKVLCMVNYIHLYSAGYKDLKEHVAAAGKVNEIYSEAFAYGPFRPNVPVLWDWGCHDVAMCIDILGRSPQKIKKNVVLTSQFQPNAELIALEFKFSEDTIARCIFGNLGEFKRRDFCVVCEEGVFAYDGLSSGLSKNYSQIAFPGEPSRFHQQLSPLECAITEFINHIASDEYVHHTLDLASLVNRILSKA
jgi:predicted dehydrogenase